MSIYTHKGSLIESIQLTVPESAPVLDAEGYATCPDCGTRIKCGPAGLKNLEKRHRGTATCQTARAKRDKNAKMKKNGSILSFLKPTAAPVPSAISHSAPVHSYRLGPATANNTSPTASTLGSRASSPVIQPVLPEPITEGFVSDLGQLVKSLPSSIPEASELDKLAIFGAEPRSFDNPAVDADELWETSLNKVLKVTLGWGKEGNMEELIRQGKWGLDGLVNFVTYFVRERGVSEELFRGKLNYLFEELEKR